MTLAVASFIPLTIAVLLLVAAHIIYSRWRPDARLAHCSGLLSLMISAPILAAIISHASLRLQFPFVDAELAAMDQFLGFHTPAISLPIALHPFWGPFFAIAYMGSFPAVFLTGLFLAASGSNDRAWELAAGFSTCILAASIIYIFVPALGSMVYYRIDTTQGLPPGSGNYHLDAIAYFRHGHDPVIDLRHFSGIVTMPSFHMVMAILVPYALRGNCIMGSIAILWGLIVTISTIAIGGHYVVDLIAGTAIWAMVACLTRSPVLPKSNARSLIPQAQQIGGAVF